MTERRGVDRALHDEHMHVQSLLRRLVGLLGEDGASLSAPDAAAARLLSEVAAVLEGDLVRHFRFEEEVLFPRLEADGGADLTAMLREEHDILLPMARQLLVQLRLSLAEALDTAGVAACRRLALEFAAMQIEHIEKEEMSLPPALEEILEPGEDREIAMAYLTG